MGRSFHLRVFRPKRNDERRAATRSAGMDRRPNAARVSSPAVWPGWIAGRTPPWVSPQAASVQSAHPGSQLSAYGSTKRVRACSAAPISNTFHHPAMKKINPSTTLATNTAHARGETRWRPRFSLTPERTRTRGHGLRRVQTRARGLPPGRGPAGNARSRRPRHTPAKRLPGPGTPVRESALRPDRPV